MELQEQSHYTFRRKDKTEQRILLIIGILFVLFGAFHFYSAIKFYDTMDEAAGQLEEQELIGGFGPDDHSELYEIRNKILLFIIILGSIFTGFGSFLMIRNFKFNGNSGITGEEISNTRPHKIRLKRN